MGNALFIVWRESVEAMLVVGILFAWIRANDVKQALPWLWGGVAAGIALALSLALVMLGIADSLSPEQMDYFQLGMVLVAAVLIVQMVLWMRKHGRTLKKELESGMASSAKQANWWGMVALVAIAVGRESAETVVFLYGLGMSGGNTGQFALVIAAGIVLAGATFWLLQQGSKWLSWRAFFRFSEIMLLMLACAMLMNGVERMMNLGWLPTLRDHLWDSSVLLDDSTKLGGTIAALTGYRAQPALTLVLAFLAYWSSITLLFRRKG